MAVDFSLTSDQEAIADAFGSFFTNESAPEVVRGAELLGHSADLWTKLIAMDAPGMAAPSSAGGSGASLSSLVVVAEALGASVAPIPLIEHWVASTCWPQADIVSGSGIATVAVRPANDDGVWNVVPAGAIAHTVIGLDAGEVVAVQSEPPMAALANHGSAPLAHRSARVGERTVLAHADLDMALDMWRVLTASALVGVASRSLAIGVDYVLGREQFGRLIGSYQAIKHGLADLPALIDGAQFLTHKAAWAFDQGLTGGQGTIDMEEGNITEFAPLASMAFLQAAQAAAATTDKSLHYHGGYGFSAEYDIQLYFRRARGWANVLGDPAHERLRLADLLWGPA